MAGLKLSLNDKNKVVNDKGQSYDSNFEEAKKQLYKDFVDNMKENSTNVEITEESLKESINKYKKLKLKKTIVLVTIIISLLSLVSFGVYNTFFRHEYTIDEIAYFSNVGNGRTNFPTYGLQGYLEVNADKFLKDKLSIDKSVKSVKIKNPIITKVLLKSDQLANVYFYIDFETNNGVNRVKCMLPIAFTGNQYSPAGEILFIITKSPIENVDPVDNPFLSFGDIPAASEELTNSSKSSVDNFFRAFYSGQPIDPIYKGKISLDSSLVQIDSKQAAGKIYYIGIDSWELYTGTNANGYNAKAVITLELPNGIIYKTVKYVLIEYIQTEKGEAWNINAVL